VTRFDPSASDPRIVTVLNARSRLAVAMLAADLTAIEALMAPDLVVNAPINKVVDRTNVLDRLKGGQLSYQPDFVDDIEFVGVRGDLVVIMSEETVRPIADTPHAGKVIRRRSTDVWREVDGAWKLIIRQATITSAE
jgi:ketosteroid isomerase-like protein